MPTDAQLREKYEAYLRGENAPPAATASDRVEEKIRNAAKSKKSVDFDMGTMIENIPDSGAKYGSDIWQAVTNPVETAKGLGKAALGGVQHLIPGEQGYEPYGSAVAEHFGNRYGGVDEFKSTLMNDPVGVLGDTAGLLGGVGMLPKMGKVGQIGSLLDPASLAISGGSKAIMNMPGISSVPNALYRTSAKFGNKVDDADVSQTALDYGIMPNDAGIARGKAIIGDIGTAIDDLITQADTTGAQIPRSKMYQFIGDVKREFGGFNLNAPKDLQKINKVIGDFEQHIKGKGKDFITVKEAQKFKQNIYKSINWKAKQGIGSQAVAETRKAIAKGAKTEIEKVLPEIKDLNFKQGELLELMDALDAPSQRIGRRDIFGLGVPMKMTAGGVAGGLPGSIMGFIVGIADNPTIKAKLALGLEGIKKQNISMANKRALSIELIRNEAMMQEEQ